MRNGKIGKFFNGLGEKIGSLFNGEGNKDKSKSPKTDGPAFKIELEGVVIAEKRSSPQFMLRRGPRIINSPVISSQEPKKAPSPLLTPEVNNYLGNAGTAMTLTEELFKHGANYTDNTYRMSAETVAKEIAAGKSFLKISSAAKVLGNSISSVQLIHSAILLDQGIITRNSFYYDLSMVGIAKFTPPIFGIPVSTIGTIYKDEIMEMKFSPHKSGHNSSMCFVAGTKVLIGDQWVNIELLHKNAFVSSYNFDRRLSELMLVSFSKSKSSTDIYEVITSVDTFLVTSEHPFYVEGKEWVKVQDLQSGDALKNLSETRIEVLTVNKSKRTQTVYNIEVDGNHNYFVGKGKVLVHNKTLRKQQIQIPELNEILKQKYNGARRK